MSSFEITFVVAFMVNLAMFYIVKSWLKKLIMPAFTFLPNWVASLGSVYVYIVSMMLALVLLGIGVSELIHSDFILVLPFKLGVISWLSLANFKVFVRDNIVVYMLVMCGVQNLLRLIFSILR